MMRIQQTVPGISLGTLGDGPSGTEALHAAEHDSPLEAARNDAGNVPSALRASKAPSGRRSRPPLPPRPHGWVERDRLPLQALVVANLIPLAGVVFFDWNARNLLLLYWLENLVVGAYTLLRMLHAGGLRALFPAAFFSFHYAFFCAGHGMFILAIATLGGADGAAAPEAFDDDAWGPLMPFHMLWSLIESILRDAPGLLTLPLLAFVVSHGISTLVHHFIGGEDKGRGADDIMFDPYKRIVALHIAILAGSMLVIGSGGGSLAPALAVLVAIKLAIDLHQHRRAHRLRDGAARTEEGDAARGPDQVEP